MRNSKRARKRGEGRVELRIRTIRSLGSRPPPFRARLNYAHAYAENIRRTNVFRIRMRII